MFTSTKHAKSRRAISDAELGRCLTADLALVRRTYPIDLRREVYKQIASVNQQTIYPWHRSAPVKLNTIAGYRLF